LEGTLVASPEMFRVVGDSSLLLAAGAIKSYVIRFSPPTALAPGAVHGSLSLGAPGCPDVDLEALVVTPLAPGPRCQLSTDSLQFGDVVVGSTIRSPLTIRNLGDQPMSGTLSASCPEYNIVGASTFLLLPGQSTTLEVEFTPSLKGVRDCLLTSSDGSC